MSTVSAFIRPQLAWAAGFSLVINLALLAPSLFMLQVYDRVLVTRSVETLVMLTVLAGVTLAAFGALDQLRSRLLNVLGMALERRFGPVILAQLIVASARQTGAGLGDGLRDLSTLRSFLSGPGVVALFDTPWAVIYMGLIMAFDWRLGAIAIASALFLLSLTWLNEKTVRAGLSATLNETRAAGRWAERSLHNAEVVTALGMSEAMTARWARQTLEVHERSLEVGARTGVVSAVSRALRQFVQVLMLGTGAYLVIREGASPGVMIATTIILGRALAPVEQVIGGWNALAEARLAHGRLSELLARPAESVVATTLPRPSGAVQVENLSYAAPENGRVLLRQVNVQIAAGELVAVVGGSGAGKTTLARLMVGVLRPSAGSVRLDGADIRQFDPRHLGPALGYLPQDVELFAGSVADNIARFSKPEGEALAADAVVDAVVDGAVDEGGADGTVADAPAHSAAIIAAAKAAGAHDMILRLPGGYDAPVGEGGRLLSGGQRQRVALARALFGDPALVVLDEPDASLDAEGEEALVLALQGLKARGATVVAVTQRRRLLAVADKVVVMRDGGVERSATRAELQASAAQASAASGNSLPPGRPAGPPGSAPASTGSAEGARA